MILALEILALILVLGFFSWFFVLYLRKKIALKRAIDMVFLEIKIPKRESKDDREHDSEQFANKDFKEMSCGAMAQFFESLYSTYSGGWHRFLTKQDPISFEYVVLDGLIYFYVACVSDLAPIMEKQITAFYPGAVVEIKEDYNIFDPNSKVVATYLTANKEYWFPFKTYENMNVDPFNAIVNSLSKIAENEGAAIQVMLRPKKSGWQEKGRKVANDLFQNKKSSGYSWYNPIGWLAGIFELLIKGEKVVDSGSQANERNTPLTDEEIKAMESKNSKPGFETLIRLVSSASTLREAQVNLSAMKSAFTQYTSSNANSFGFTSWHNKNKLISNFVFRNFDSPLHVKPMIISTNELASIFHFPNARFNTNPNISWQNYKITPAPSNIPTEGLLLGHNTYRGQKRKICMKDEDRFRHFYVIGQTGTGKSSQFETMIRQDFKNGKGLCVIDPHGTLIENIMPFIPRERADDVIYFNPSDLERPMGLNILEASSPEEAEMVALDAMNIMIKLFDEEIFGPRIQDYFRNGCLTLMADPAGGAITDIVRLFTDDDFQKMKVKHVKNPIVRSFWENQMAKTGAREKQEMIPYFAAKFGQFVTNSMMRNIIGQAKSAFDFSEVMQGNKILLMNLSKGTVGEINSKLLGLITVQKIQMATLRREKIKKEERKDFFLYIDEFQNYVTDSIESILSEARKYRLGLNIAHQYIAQIDDSAGKKGVNLKDAIFGNVGTIMSYKIGAQDAEHMAREFAPVFSDQDLINMDKFKGVIRLAVDSQPSRAFSITPVNPGLETGDYEAAEAFKQLSRLKYGRDKDFVEREILRRIGAV